MHSRLPAGLDIPAELARREGRMQAIREAKIELDARAAVRTAAEQAVYGGKLKASEDKEKDTGQKSRGKPPTPGVCGILCKRGLVK